MKINKIPPGLSSQPKKRAFTTLILICICLVLVPIYSVWDRKILRPDLDYASSSTANAQNRTITHDGPTIDVVSSKFIQTPTTEVRSNSVRPSSPPPSTVTTMTIDRSRYPLASRLVNIPDFEFLVNPDICPSDDQVFMLVMVGSHPKNNLVREAIRSTWGNPNITGYPFKIVFMFGKFENSFVQELLNTEIKLRGDIVQGNFIDSYHNVTARDVMALRWAWSYCPQAKFIMRADDDISVDVFVLKDVLEQKFGDYDVRNESLLACFAQFVGAPVLREGNYAVSKAEHPADTYEKYCSGWMYVVNPLAAKQLDIAGLRVKSFWMNDAYITGTLSAAAAILIRNLNIGHTFNYDDMVAMLNVRPRLPVRYSIGYVGTDTKLMMNLHEKYKQEYFNKFPQS